MKRWIVVSVAVLILMLFTMPVLSDNKDQAAGSNDTKLTTAEDINKLRKAAESGDAKSQFDLGMKYLLGESVAQDFREAFKWYTRAAEQGFAEAQCGLGIMYYYGQGVTQDYKEAIKWYTKAAEQGYTDAQSFLGGIYLSDKIVAQDFKEAVKWFMKAAERGHAGAQFALGNIYYNGWGVTQDYKEAAKWYTKAAEQGDTAERVFTQAQFNLGLMYFNGQGVTQNFKEAAKWYARAAEQGMAEAQFALALMYEFGKGVIASPSIAADWYYKAGMASLKQGKKELAFKSYDNIQRVFPDHFLGKRLFAAIYEGAKNGKSEELQPGLQQALSGTGWSVTGQHIVTNEHVIRGATKITVTLYDGKKVSANVVLADSANDLAILQIQDAQTRLSVLPLIYSLPKPGEQIVTIGFPNPELFGGDPKVTEGIVNAISGVGGDPRTFQLSAQVHPGNSGGPILNMHGEVVGIAVAKLDAVKVFQWTGDIPENVGYAIKTFYLKPLLESAGIVKVESTGKPVLAKSVGQIYSQAVKSVVLITVLAKRD